MQSQKIILQEMGGRKSEKEDAFKSCKVFSNFMFGDWNIWDMWTKCSCRVRCVKERNNTAAVNISKDGWTMTAAFRKSNSSHIMKTKLYGTRFQGHMWWEDKNGEETVKIYYKSGKINKIKAKFSKKSQKKYNGVYKVYNVIKAPKLSAIKEKGPYPYGDGVIYSVTWSKVSGAKGYQCKVSALAGEWWNMYVKRSTSHRSASVEGSDIEKVKFKVRAYKKVNGISVYGSWSNVRSKKCW